MIGQSIGSYEIVAKLGEGGMGAVYLGEHRRIARKAAIKVLLPELSVNHQIVERFFNEARATSLIKHPGIVEVTDCDVLPSGNAYIVMEFLEGESLGNYLRRGERLSVQRAAFLTRYVADALAVAHDKGIVHRDLKPDNVFLVNGGGAAAAPPIKILDFGIAKLLNAEVGRNQHKTRTGSIVGTPVYMSPEQCRGTGNIDHRTDIYSLGCMFFEMLTGHPPFTSEGFGELIQAHLSVVPPSIRTFDPAIPQTVDALVARMLAKAPADRPQTMRDLVTELDAAMAGEPGVVAAPVAIPLAEPSVVAPRPVQSRTVALPAVQTTLRSASAERLDVVSTGSDVEVPRARRTGPFIAAAIGLVVAVGGFGAWRARTPAVVIATVPPPLPEPQPPPPPPPPPPPQRDPIPIEKHEEVVAPLPVVEPAKEKVPKPSPSPPRPKVLITSDPPGADVCLATDRVLLGKTSFEWSPQKGSRGVKLLVRKTGYRGAEISVSAGDDTKKRVELDKLGPDDIDDVVNCRPR